MTQETEPSRYLEYLPAIFHQDPYLGQFLLPFDQQLKDFEDLLSSIDRYFTPALTPALEDRDFLSWLAGWVALVLDEHWEEAKQRRLIHEAVRLYRYRGMAAGLKGYFRIYDVDIVPDIREWRWPGGMQIGVASQIGGTSNDLHLTRIERAERRHPSLAYDYYVVDTVAPAGHPNASRGKPLRLYYRADRVKRVEVGGEERESYVKIRLLDGRTRHHEPAIVIRRDGLLDERYTLTLVGEEEPETVFYRGDTFLIDDIELPYCFTVNLQVPCTDWEFLFSFPIDPQTTTLPEAFWHEFEFYGIPLSDDISVSMEEKGHRWWKIDDNDKEQQYLAVRKGIVLDVLAWVGCEDWEKAKQPRSARTYKAIIDEVKPAHTAHYLKLTPKVCKRELQPIQIGVRSTIDVDTSTG
jgi:phage tail-like protein